MRSVGIDLGTSNSVAAIDGTVIQHASGLETSSVLPSVVAFPPSGAQLVGATAKKRRAIDPKNTLYSAKRVIGRRWLSQAATRFRREYPFEMRENAAGGVVFRTRAGDLTPIDIAARVVAKLFAGQQTFLANATAIVTVPASFEEPARSATLRAVEQAGFARAVALEEPIATALAYAATGATRALRALVYDFGGGTFDLALLEHDAKGARVLRHGGDAYLGGDDIDRAISSWAADEVLKKHGWDLRADAEILDRLHLQCEQAKLRLSVALEAQLQLGQIDPSAPAALHTLTLTRDRLDTLAMPFLQRTFAVADAVLREAGVRPDQVDAVYLAGGGTLMPCVRDGVAAYFGRLPRCDFDPLQVVAVGASLMPPAA